MYEATLNRTWNMFIDKVNDFCFDAFSYIFLFEAIPLPDVCKVMYKETELEWLLFALQVFDCQQRNLLATKLERRNDAVQC